MLMQGLGKLCCVKLCATTVSCLVLTNYWTAPGGVQWSRNAVTHILQTRHVTSLSSVTEESEVMTLCPVKQVANLSHCRRRLNLNYKCAAFHCLWTQLGLTQLGLRASVNFTNTVSLELMWNNCSCGSSPSSTTRCGKQTLTYCKPWLRRVDKTETNKNWMNMNEEIIANEWEKQKEAEAGITELREYILYWWL